ncbi:MAG: hypothetical protein Q4P07_06935 [Ornithinimicrobium sp.]|uniref:hypothetical protein n=1 Tax=Ornithinimicrobium sp. TaxID=1977084 RepID=UPI0026DF95DD|nr:hypothetical protein [Ornithinimicrobium sp.]MDO5739868.1 hypothetical protein [Ornithinimicrobium sp.]
MRFKGQIAGVGSTSGVRVVIGCWACSPLGSFSDAMIELPRGHRILLAPTEEIAVFVSTTYTFDEIRVEDFVTVAKLECWRVRSASLELDLEIGSRTGLGRVLQLVPRGIAESPAWARLTDPVARTILRGVRTQGISRGRHEFYGATDHHDVTALRGALDGVPLGSLAPVQPPPRFGFGSTPARPSVTALCTTVRFTGPRPS